MFLKYPRAMLRSRVITAGLKSVGWEGGAGNYDPSEMIAFSAGDGADDRPAGVTEDGEDRRDEPEARCPVCQGAMWDNRESKTNPKAPDFKCRDRSCSGVYWPGQWPPVEKPLANEVQIERLVVISQDERVRKDTREKIVEALNADGITRERALKWIDAYDKKYGATSAEGEQRPNPTTSGTPTAIPSSGPSASNTGPAEAQATMTATEQPPSLDAAMAYPLPGDEQAWGGYGGKPLGECSDSLLERVTEWATAHRATPGGFTRAGELLANISVVRDAHRGVVRLGTQGGPAPDLVQAMRDDMERCKEPRSKGGEKKPVNYGAEGVIPQ
jgi:hypothetical protein